MRILISAFSNLYTDQRIEKVCATLHAAGYEVELIGTTFGGSSPMERPYSFSRIAQRTGNLKLAYPVFNWKLYFELRKKANSKTILLANDLDALGPNVLISKQLNIPLVFDSHEIFTEMPAIQGRITQKIWRFLEKTLIKYVPYMMTESVSYARWFQEKYQQEAAVIRNIPRKITKTPLFPDNHPKIIIYQGAINQSRGIPQAILSLHLLDHVILKIAGEGPKKAEYETLVKKENLSHKVQFMGKLSPEELRNFTSAADVSLSIEENGGVSYYYSLPNKVGDSIQARVPLVMINFPEMQRVYDQFKVGELVENHDPQNLAQKIKIVLENGRQFYRHELDRAAEELCWEKEERKIITLFNRVVAENF